ncbi:MAG: uracil-DNA glycosylase [Candidatus Omnitrophica bacterium]|nr:uracil-DNA glycosylase [Candidatus Omnitrophota bacterium]MBU1932385.1 uracil-DNA glycosylase [Candidatus Omnitrophota bacterium]
MKEDILKTLRAYFEMEKESGVEEYLLSPKKKDESLSLKEEVFSCHMCGLCKTRKNVVFGSGNLKARLMFVGEAPGFDEDVQGLPFVGKAGILLTKIIEAMGLKREDVYICNILKCRPPQNRNPLPDEIASCIGYLSRQIDYIKPRVICGLGKFASQTLLKTETPITRLRGTWHEYRTIKFMPTYHPAYLLRNPSDKKLVWQDMKKIMEIL